MTTTHSIMRERKAGREGEGESERETSVVLLICALIG